MSPKIVGLIAIVVILGVFLWRSPFSTQAPKQITLESISAGGAEGYDIYTLDKPSDWSVVEDTEEGLSKLKVSKNGYEIYINQEPGGGIECLYNGPEVEYPQTNYTQFNEISTKEGKKFRRGKVSDNKFEFCQKSDDGWSAPTVAGYIYYVVPKNPDNTILREMDEIITSLSIIEK